MGSSTDPSVSFVIPARNEASYLGDCLESLAALDTDHRYEVVVVDGDSADATAAIAREFGATVVHGPGRNIGHGRNLGARRADGDWLAFVDADTTVDPTYLEEMLAFVRRESLDAASSRCRIDGFRPKLMQYTINHVFPRLRRPILPGFNVFVDRSVYESVDGFPEVPNEDTAFSRLLAREYDTRYHPATLVHSSGRRIHRSGLTGTLYHYLRLDVGRIRASY